MSLLWRSVRLWCHCCINSSNVFVPSYSAIWLYSFDRPSIGSGRMSSRHFNTVANTSVCLWLSPTSLISTCCIKNLIKYASIFVYFILYTVELWRHMFILLIYDLWVNWMWLCYCQLAGATYMDIHEAGGGINFTVEQTRNASEETLYELFKERMHQLLKSGECVPHSFFEWPVFCRRVVVAVSNLMKAQTNLCEM